MADCSIFTGGKISDLSFIKTEKVKRTYIICADSGYNYAQNLGLNPDLILGDYDSLGFVPKVGCDVLSYPIEKDDTDLMLAVKEALSLGYKSIDIYGALGGRIDHTLGNIQALGYIAEHNGEGRILSDNDEIRLLNSGTYSIEKRSGFSLSLLAYSDKVCGLSINGVKYTAENVDISNTFPLGISNTITEKRAEISFNSGRLMVIQSRL